MKPYKAILIVLAVLLLDQGLKIWVKTHMMLEDQIAITHWFKIHFVENSGMAFSMELPSRWGKIMLRLFRLIAVVAGMFYIKGLFDKKAHWGFITASCIILAGAIGNLIDGAFYGLLFSDSFGRVSEFLPKGGGYAAFMQGDVVDMLRFPLYHGILPNWIPVWGGQYFEFFNAIFNISDAAIFIGVMLIIIFQKQFFKKPPVETTEEIITPSQTEENPGSDPHSFPS